MKALLQCHLQKQRGRDTKQLVVKQSMAPETAQCAI